MPGRSCGGSLGFLGAEGSEAGGGGDILAGPLLFFLEDEDFLEDAGAGAGAGAGAWKMGAA